MDKSMTSIDSSPQSSNVVESNSFVETNSRSAGWKDFIEISKTGIVTSNLITTFAGLWLALHFTGEPLLNHIGTFIWTLLGTAFIVAGGCALNNYVDRDIDPVMERTRERPSATGVLSGNHILWYGLIMSVLGTMLLMFTTYSAAVFGLLGLFVYVVVYTMWLKRTHSINTIVGSVSGALPPVIGWAAIDPNLSQVAWVLFLIMFLWQPPHFLALAMKRVEDYREAGVPMLPVVAGFKFTMRQINVYIAALFVVSLFLYPLGTLYLVVASVLGLGWLGIGLAGRFMKDDIVWARIMFVYSLNYLTILFVFMVIVAI